MPKNQKSASQVGLIVPVDVVAFCVGEVDYNEVTNGFAGTTVVYSQQVTPKTEAFLGSNVTRSFSDAPLQQLEQGIHLHWAMPDALTKGIVSGEKLIFPALPNRWLVTRLMIRGTEPAAKTWIVESDVLMAQIDNQQAAKPITLPVKIGNGQEQDYRFVGKRQLFESSWHEPAVWPGESFGELTGNELNAVSNGTASFAAYYPDCRSVFGFYDDLNDLALTDSTSADLMYIVTGWYGNSQNDPLGKGLGLQEIRENYDWTFADDGIPPSFSLYSGIVQDIVWNPKRNYLYQQSLLQPVKVEAVVGNNPAEAISAYFRDRNHSKLPFFEELLNGFQQGLLNSFTKPQADQLAGLAEELRAKEFGAYDSGSIYTIVKEGAGDDSGEPEVKTLPLNLANELNLLNIYQQQNDWWEAYLNSYRWVLFADWYRIFNAGSDDIKNTAFNIAYDRCGKWNDLQNTYEIVSHNLSKQRENVEKMMLDGLILKKISAPRYWQPNEPVVLLVGDELAPPLRYGGDTRYTENEWLECRLTTQVLSGVAVNGTAIAASRFNCVRLGTPNGLAYSGPINALLQEACMLNTRLGAAISGVGEAARLKEMLESGLAGQSQALYVFNGKPPSPVGVGWWQGNPWLPLFLEWEVSFQPLLATRDGDELKNYPAQFFTSNYQIDRQNGGSINYRPDQSPFAININPAEVDNVENYRGSALLASSPAHNFTRQLKEYLKNHTDTTLQTILEQLEQTQIMAQSLGGFNNALVMRHQSIQLAVKVPADSLYNDLTQEMAQYIGNMNVNAPSFNSYFNPLRAGYIKELNFRVIGAYGQRREVIIDKLICAETLTAYYQGQVIPETVYLPPRLAQPGRLLFRWLAANSTGLEEMNEHPATSPICGWLMPSHLQFGFSLYSQNGKPLGLIFLNASATEVKWQPFPGDNRTIDHSMEAVFQFENPQLREVALALRNNSPDFFKAFWSAVDQASESINTQDIGTDSGLAVLTGRPVALVQASLRLELQGRANINQSWVCLAKNEFQETDHGFTSVNFPVELGDLSQFGDGMIGYFKQNNEASGYELKTFYSEAAGVSSTAGVVRAGAANITLTANPPIIADRPGEDANSGIKVLILMEPKGQIHAKTGILPTKSLVIPPDQYTDALNTMETTLQVAPVLRGNGSMILPLPQENGYQFSWIEERENENRQIEWSVTSEIASPSGREFWGYTPQKIVEGWLKLNPQLLEFSLVNCDGKPMVSAGEANSLRLEILNRKPGSITFNPGQLIPEGSLNQGTVFYLHLGLLVNATDITQIKVSAPGWQFQNINSSKHGVYWAGTPAPGNPVFLGQNEKVGIVVENVRVLAVAAQLPVYFNYYNIEGLNDGTSKQLLTVQQPVNAG